MYYFEKQRLGKMYFLGNSSIKAHCSVHPDCKLFIETCTREGEERFQYFDVMKKMMKFIALAGTLGSKEHFQEGISLRQLGFTDVFRI